VTLAEAIDAGDLLAVARHYAAAGLSVVPVRADGSKAPKFQGWQRYGDAPPTPVQLVEWFGRGEAGGLGIPGGPASGNLTVLDFETAEVWGRWLSLLSPERRAHADACPLARTPRGGAHLYVRLELPTRGVLLAERPDGIDDAGRPKTKTLIETRGHGQQVLAPGCPPACHELNVSYRWEREAWVGGGESREVPLPVWIEWLELAASLTQVERRREERRADTRDRRAVSADDPGTDFNHRGTWDEAGLFAAGWEWERCYGDDRGTVRRPGKGAGVSGTLGIVSSRDNGWPLFHCFTTSAAPFDGGGNYSRFSVFAELVCGGDYKAAARRLREMGYGRQNRAEPGVTWRPTNDRPPPDDDTPGRAFKWASELAAPPKAEDWIWEGYLPRAAVSLLSALWKVGKTTLLSHLLRACGEGGEFLGKPIRASKVLYVSEEGERHWVRRRDALGLEDNTGFYLQPFPTRPDPKGWKAFVDQLAQDVRVHGFDLVVFDTLAKLWPVTEENDAGAVDAALMCLWEVTRAGAGVLLIHHLRKSGGQEYTGSRGSGALSAFPDILIELTRFDAAEAKSKKRVLRAKGRYEETPDELVIELIDGRYVAVDVEQGAPGDSVIVFGSGKRIDPDAAAEMTEEERVVAVMTVSVTPWLTCERIRDAVRATDNGIRNEDISRHLASLYKREQVVIRGRLRSKTSPREWALASRVDLVPPLGQSGNEITGTRCDGGREPPPPHLVPDISFPLDPGAERDEDTGNETDGGFPGTAEEDVA
jgi:hypothetical protein